MDKRRISDNSTEKSGAHYENKDARSEYSNHSRVRSEDLLLIILLCNCSVSLVRSSLSHKNDDKRVDV